MKKKFFGLTTCFLCFAFAAFAQPNFGGLKRTIEERVKIVHDKFDSTFTKELSQKQMDDVDSAFADYYRAQDKMREELMAAGGVPDREALRTKTQEMIVERDEKLKKILNQSQFKKWKEELEPAMRPQRRMPG